MMNKPNMNMSVKEMVDWYFTEGKNGYWKTHFMDDGRPYNYDNFLEMLSDEFTPDEFNKRFIQGIQINSQHGETLIEAIEAVFRQLTIALAINLYFESIIIDSALIMQSRSSRWN